MRFLYRIRVELIIMAIIGILLFALGLSDTSPIGHALFLYKILLFSASQVHAIVVRKAFFPYIDFNAGKSMHQAMIIAIHVGAAYLYAVGG